MKLANPLHYPLAVLAGGIVLFVGVRFIKLSSVVILPLAGAIAFGGSVVLKSREPEPLNIDNPALAKEIQGVKGQAQKLAVKAEALRGESETLLTTSTQLELLSTVQFACDRAKELPAKIDHLASRLQGKDSLLSVPELQKQLTEVQAKQLNSSGVAYQQLNQLAASLQRNIQLAQEGEDARQAQVISLSTVITDLAGTLQQLQNKLRTADLEDSAQIQELRSLSEEMSNFQENVDLLVKA